MLTLACSILTLARIHHGIEKACVLNNMYMFPPAQDRHGRCSCAACQHVHFSDVYQPVKKIMSSAPSPIGIAKEATVHHGRAVTTCTSAASQQCQPLNVHGFVLQFRHCLRRSLMRFRFGLTCNGQQLRRQQRRFAPTPPAEQASRQGINPDHRSDFNMCQPLHAEHPII